MLAILFADRIEEQERLVIQPNGSESLPLDMSASGLILAMAVATIFSPNPQKVVFPDRTGKEAQRACG